MSVEVPILDTLRPTLPHLPSSLTPSLPPSLPSLPSCTTTITSRLRQVCELWSFPLCCDLMAEFSGQPSGAARRAAAALDASALAADHPHGPGSCSPPQCWSEREGGDAAERRPTGTEDRRQGRGGGGARDALRPRAQETPPPGARPGILAEPGPQRSDRSRRHFSGDCLPTLGLPVLAGALGEQVDSSTLRLLTAAALKAKRKLEEEEKEKAKMKKLKEEM